MATAAQISLETYLTTSMSRTAIISMAYWKIGTW